MTVPALPVIPEELYVDVIPDDIAAGTPGNCAKCPVALAAERAWREALPGEPTPYVQVISDAILIFPGTPSSAITYPLPLEAQVFLRHFDDWGEGAWGAPPEPLSFTATREE